jgi:hypothetical protein
MSARLALFVPLFVAGTACSSTTTVVAAPGHDAGGETLDAGSAGDDDGGGGADAEQDTAAPVDTLTWTYIYTTYFGPNTPGHCGNAGCHETIRGGFVCSSKTGCYSSLVNSAWITPSSPTASPIGDPTQSILAWYGMGGTMPQDGVKRNATAGSDVTAWVKAGAKNN